MKFETVIPEKDRKQIEYYQSKIQERMESYFDDIDCASAFSIRDMTKAISMMNNDSIIKLCEKCIENVYTYSVPQTILIAENEEDKKILDDLIGLIDKSTEIYFNDIFGYNYCKNEPCLDDDFPEKCRQCKFKYLNEEVN